METLTIQPKNKAETAMLKAILKALKVSFKSNSVSDTEKPYDPAFVEKIKRSSQQAKEGKVTRIAIADLWKQRLEINGLSRNLKNHNTVCTTLYL